MVKGIYSDCWVNKLVYQTFKLIFLRYVTLKIIFSFSFLLLLGFLVLRIKHILVLLISISDNLSVKVLVGLWSIHFHLNFIKESLFKQLIRFFPYQFSMIQRESKKRDKWKLTKSVYSRKNNREGFNGNTTKGSKSQMKPTWSVKKKERKKPFTFCLLPSRNLKAIIIILFVSNLFYKLNIPIFFFPTNEYGALGVDTNWISKIFIISGFISGSIILLFWFENFGYLNFRYLWKIGYLTDTRIQSKIKFRIMTIIFFLQKWRDIIVK